VSYEWMEGGFFLMQHVVPRGSMPIRSKRRCRAGCQNDQSDQTDEQGSRQPSTSSTGLGTLAPLGTPLPPPPSPISLAPLAEGGLERVEGPMRAREIHAPTRGPCRKPYVVGEWAAQRLWLEGDSS
jgi:hypothetical protein